MFGFGKRLAGGPDSREITRLTDQVMRLRTEIRDALEKTEINVATAEQAKQAARAAQARARRHEERARNLEARHLAAQSPGSGAVDPGADPDAVGDAMSVEVPIR